MKNKKSKEEPIEQVVTEDEVSVETPVEEGPSDEELIAMAEAKAKEYRELAQRVQAEFDNYRKRNNESVRNARIEGGNEVILGLLPLADTMEIALKMVTDEKSKEGIQLIYKQLKSLLEKYEVTEIEAQGEAFDPDLHHAVLQIEDAEQAGKVVEVLQKGYRRSGKVIRYAMVKVAQ